MFFEDIFEVFEDEMWLPIIASTIEEEQERSFFDMSDEEIRSYYENDKLGKL